MLRPAGWFVICCVCSVSHALKTRKERIVEITAFFPLQPEGEGAAGQQNARQTIQRLRQYALKIVERFSLSWKTFDGRDPHGKNAPRWKIRAACLSFAERGKVIKRPCNVPIGTVDGRVTIDMTVVGICKRMNNLSGYALLLSWEIGLCVTDIITATAANPAPGTTEKHFVPGIKWLTLIPPPSSVTEANPLPEIIVFCVSIPGTVSRVPSTVVCLLPLMNHENDVAAKCGLGQNLLYTMEPVASAEMCLADEKMFVKKIQWLFAKLNYLMLTCNALFLAFLFAQWHWRIGKKTSRVYLYAYFGMNGVWVVWRLQETLNWENNWRSDYPYVCVFTNYVRYCAEAGMLYMFACTSLHRLQAISRPLKWRSRKMPRLLDVVAITVGFLVGFVISTLNLVALVDMGEARVKQFCRIDRSLLGKFPLLFILVIKVLNLSLVFVLPFLVTLASNFAMLIALAMSSRNRPENRVGEKGSSNSWSFSWVFLITSSIIIAFFLAEPAIEMKLAAHAYKSGTVPAHTSADAIAEGTLWNLTAFAYMVVSLSGIRYSPQK